MHAELQTEPAPAPTAERPRGGEARATAPRGRRGGEGKQQLACAQPRAATGRRQTGWREQQVTGAATDNGSLRARSREGGRSKKRRRGGDRQRATATTPATHTLVLQWVHQHTGVHQCTPVCWCTPANVCLVFGLHETLYRVLSSYGSFFVPKFSNNLIVQFKSIFTVYRLTHSKA